MKHFPKEKPEIVNHRMHRGFLCVGKTLKKLK